MHGLMVVRAIENTPPHMTEGLLLGVGVLGRQSPDVIRTVTGHLFTNILDVRHCMGCPNTQAKHAMHTLRA